MKGCIVDCILPFFKFGNNVVFMLYFIYFFCRKTVSTE